MLVVWKYIITLLIKKTPERKITKTFFFHTLDAVDPFVLLLRCGGGDAVHHVVSFHHPSVSLCLARLDQLTTVVGNVELETVLRQ